MRAEQADKVEALEARIAELERQLATEAEASAELRNTPTESEQISSSGEPDWLAKVNKERAEAGVAPLDIAGHCSLNPHTKECQLYAAEIESANQWTENEATATPTPDLFIERMKWTQAAQALEAEVPGVIPLIAPSSLNGAWRGWLERFITLYVPVYMASACLDGVEPSREGFKEMVTTGVVMDSSGGIRSNLESQARWLIQKINEKEEAATDFCSQSYLYPESMADARPAIDLYLALTSGTVPDRFRGGLTGLINDHAAGWFNATEPRQPFIRWLCGWSSNNPCGLPAAEGAAEGSP
jgi:hypothetical protein